MALSFKEILDNASSVLGSTTKNKASSGGPSFNDITANVGRYTAQMQRPTISARQKSVADDFVSRIGTYDWKSNYAYDVWSDEDAQRQERGEMPLSLYESYNLDDPVDRYLYNNNLPPKKDLEKWAEKAEKEAEDKAEETAYEQYRAQIAEAEKTPFEKIVGGVKAAIDKGATLQSETAPKATAQPAEDVPMYNGVPFYDAVFGDGQPAQPAAQPKSDWFSRVAQNAKFDNPAMQSMWNRKVWEAQNMREPTEEELKPIVEELLKTGDYEGSQVRSANGMAAGAGYITAEEKALEDAKDIYRDRQNQAWLEYVGAPKDAKGSFLYGSKYDYEGRVVANEMTQAAVNSAGFKPLEQLQAEAEAEGKRLEGIYKTTERTAQMVQPIYLQMTDEQKAAYYYYKERGLGDEYLDALTPELTDKAAEATKKLWTEEIPIPIIGDALLAFTGGLESGTKGLIRLATDNYAARTEGASTQAAQQNRAEVAQGNDIWSKLAGIGLDVLYSTGNMAPSLVAGTANPALGAATIGASSAGNAMNEALKEGASKEQATLYGLMNGTAEAVLQYLLGGIGKLSGNLTGKSFGKMLAGAMSRVFKNPKVAQAFARHIGGAIDEGIEEYINGIIDPVIRNIALNEDNIISLVNKEAGYGALLGAITGGLLGSGNSSADARINTEATTNTPAAETPAQAEIEAPVEAVQTEQAEAEPAIEVGNEVSTPLGDGVVDNVIFDPMAGANFYQVTIRDDAGNYVTRVFNGAEVSSLEAPAVEVQAAKTMEEQAEAEIAQALETEEATDAELLDVQPEVIQEVKKSMDFDEELEYWMAKGYDENTALAMVGRYAKDLRAAMRNSKKQDAKTIREIKREMRQNTEQKLKELREANRAKVKQVRAEAKEKQNVRKYRQRVVDKTNKLRSMLSKPSSETHIPAPLTDKVVKLLDVVQNGNTRRSRELADALNDFRAQLNTFRSSDAHVDGADYAEQLKEMLPEGYMEALDEYVYALGNDRVNIKELTADELKTLDFLTSALYSAVNNVNKVWSKGRFSTISDMANSTIEEAERTGKETRKDGKLKKLADSITASNQDAVSFFGRLGEGGRAVIDGLLDGFETTVAKVRKASEWFSSMRESTELKDSDIKAWTTKPKTYDVGGQKIQLTDAQLMSLYCLNKRADGRKHIYGGGIQSETIRSGGRSIEQHRNIKVTEADVNALLDNLSPKQKEVADAMQQYLSSDVAQWGNETSMRMYMYEGFTDPNYFPIKTAGDTRTLSDPDKARAFNAIANNGFTKSTNFYARNPLVLSNIFNVFSQHVSQMASYNGLAAPLQDTMRWRNYRGVDENGNRNDNASVAKAIRDVYGNGGTEFFTKLVKDINGLSEGDYGTDFSSKLVTNWKRTMVAGKLRTVVQQYPSIVRAFAEISPKYFFGKKGQSIKETVAEMHEHSPLAYWKSQGNFEIGTGRNSLAMVTGYQTAMNKIVDKTMAASGLMDDLAWSDIWNAVKRETAATTDLKKGSAEYWDHVSHRFRYIVGRTQVVDTVFHRPQIMRSKDKLMEMASAFMSEPIKTYNMLVESAVAAQRGDKGAKARLARTAVALVANAAGQVAIKSLYDALKRRGEEDKYGQELDFWELLGQEATAEALGEINPFNYIPFARDIVSMLEGFDVVRTDMDGISDVIKAGEKLSELAINGYTKESPYEVYADTASAVGNLLGIPFSGLRDTTEWVINAVDPDLIQREDPMYKYRSNHPEEYQILHDSGLTDEEIVGILDDLKQFKKIEDKNHAISAAVQKREYVDDGDFTVEQQMVLMGDIDSSFTKNARVAEEEFGISNEQFLEYEYERVRIEVEAQKYKRDHDGDSPPVAKSQQLKNWLKSQGFTEEQALYLYELHDGYKWKGWD